MQRTDSYCLILMHSKYPIHIPRRTVPYSWLHCPSLCGNGTGRFTVLRLEIKIEHPIEQKFIRYILVIQLPKQEWKIACWLMDWEKEAAKVHICVGEKPKWAVNSEQFYTLRRWQDAWCNNENISPDLISNNCIYRGYDMMTKDMWEFLLH
jgi:hypothetical protein